jgi:V/A-type H+-transporting ATPase subunit I
MFFPEKMLLINAIFLEKDADRVAETVIRQGDLQIADAGQINPWLKEMAQSYSEEETSQFRSRREKVENLVRSLKLTDQLKEVQPLARDWSEIDRQLETISPEIESAIQQHEIYAKELHRLNELKSRYDRFPGIGRGIQVTGGYSYLAIETGQIPETNLEILEEQLGSTLHVTLPIGSAEGMLSIVVIVLKRDVDLLHSALNAAGFRVSKTEKESSALAAESLEMLERNSAQTAEKLHLAEDRLQSIVNQHQAFLTSAFLRIRHEQLFSRMLHFFRRTEQTCLFSGWLPESRRPAFVKELEEVTQKRAVINITPAEAVESVKEGQVEVPVKLRNPAFFKPFELLTAGYGLPRYQTIDPTPILGVSFLLMFGLMFGDVGHGLVLALAGLWLALKSKRDTLRSGGWMALYAGCASIIFGFLFGSIFGVEDWLPTIWIKPMQSINLLFKVVIYYGIGLITLSVIINLVNGIRSGNLIRSLFDKAGLISGILYWCGIILVSKMLLSKTGEGVGLLVIYIAIACGLLLFFHEPVIQLIKKNYRRGSEIMNSLMQALVEMLEIGLGFLANTVSFIRVAAFGLAHAGLFIAIFALSDMVSGKLAGLASALVLIFGNLLIIVLEGLVVTIQAIRLEFYEFFSRFFRTSRAIYKPVSMNLNVE